MKYLFHSIILTVMMIVGLSICYSAFALENCRNINLPSDPDNTYCQSGNFEIVGFPESRQIWCKDYQDCCNFMEETYEGERSCCTDSNCMQDCVNFPVIVDPEEEGWVWYLLDDVDDCEGDEGAYPYSIYINCMQKNKVWINKPAKFCGNCDEGDLDKGVCVKFDCYFNPNLSSEYTAWYRRHNYASANPNYDCFAPRCWDICGSDSEVLIVCADADWEDCNPVNPGCQTF